MIALAIAGASPVALADGIQATLSSDTSNTRVVMIDHPADKTGNTVIVAWDHLPGDHETGALVFKREKGSDDSYRYFSIGGHAPFQVIDRGRLALTSGSTVPVFEIDTFDKNERPLQLRAVTDKTIDAGSMQAKYEAYEHVVASGGQTGATQAIKAASDRTAKVCGKSPAIDVAWGGFKKPELASQAAAIYEALELACADKDYKAAVGKLGKLHVTFREQGALELKLSGGTLEATVSPASWNPREVARTWLKDNL
ncbi:MAG: hypothetical protein QM831_27615 [Kofleriaceae bacterium]